MTQESNNNFASKDGNPRAASTRIGAVTAKKLAGQIRHDLRRGPQPGYIDADRMHLNRVIMEPLPPGQMRSICSERRSLRKTSRAMRSNAAIGTRGVITFGAEAAQLFETLTPDQQDAAFREVAQAVADRLATSLHGLVVHCDEATIHAHYQLAAFNLHGQPVSKTTSPKVLSELQDITAEIMARHCPGIERGNRYGDRIAAGADFADTLHKSVKELHRTLPADLAAKREALAALVEAETRAVARVEEMQARVDKLTGKADLTDKDVKRLETYKNRLSDRVSELEIAKSASEAARAEADRLADLARTDRQNEEAKAEKIRAKTAAVVDAVSSLTAEISAGTIKRNSDGRITVAAPERLKPALPEIRPVVSAAVDLVMKVDAARSDLATDQAALRSEQRELINAQNELIKEGLEVQSMKMALKKALSRVLGFIKRRGVDDDAVIEGRAILLDETPILLPAKDATEDTGPGL